MKLADIVLGAFVGARHAPEAFKTKCWLHLGDGDCRLALQRFQVHNDQIINPSELNKAPTVTGPRAELITPPTSSLALPFLSDFTGSSERVLPLPELIELTVSSKWGKHSTTMPDTELDAPGQR